MQASVSMRLFFGFISCMLWAGIALTGFANVHWLLYMPAVVSLFAAVTGICPSLILISKMISGKRKHTSIN